METSIWHLLSFGSQTDSAIAIAISLHTFLLIQVLRSIPIHAPILRDRLLHFRDRLDDGVPSHIWLLCPMPKTSGYFMSPGSSNCIYLKLSFSFIGFRWKQNCTNLFECFDGFKNRISLTSPQIVNLNFDIISSSSLLFVSNLNSGVWWQFI